jgi:hypothetical protein
MVKCNVLRLLCNVDAITFTFLLESLVTESNGMPGPSGALSRQTALACWCAMYLNNLSFNNVHKAVEKTIERRNFSRLMKLVSRRLADALTTCAPMYISSRTALLEDGTLNHDLVR